jgi:hypothetical protein
MTMTFIILGKSTWQLQHAWQVYMYGELYLTCRKCLLALRRLVLSKHSLAISYGLGASCPELGLILAPAAADFTDLLKLFGYGTLTMDSEPWCSYM